MNSVSNTSHDTPVVPLMSDELYAIFDLVVVQYLLTGISLFGVVSNLMNIVVYAKMGFSDTSNINFLALSLSDLVTVLYTLIAALGHIPAVANMEVGVAPLSVQNILVPVFYPAMAFSSWVTALISTERCFCIAYPLKVKTIFTTRRVFIMLVILLCFEFSSMIPHYLTMNLTWHISAATNRSVLHFSFTEYSAQVSVTILIVFFSIPSLISFFEIVICTSFLVVRLGKSLDWRKSNLSQTDTKNSLREVKIVRFVISICVIYIICFTPNVIILPISMGIPRLHVMDPYLGNVVWLVFYTGVVLQSISSSANIFVYYSMSTKYKTTLDKALCGDDMDT